MKNQLMQNRQRGAGLMEVLVAMSISLVVTAAMVALMVNSLGTTTRIIKMTKLSDDMRIAMQMMTRDVRRSSYNANSMLCYSNKNCLEDGSVIAAGDINIDGGNCFTFLMDRDHDGDSTENDAGGFRHVTKDGVGLIEMWTGDATPDCSDDEGGTGWVQITDPDDMDIVTFNVDDALSYEDTIQDDALGNEMIQKVRKIRINMSGQLVLDNTIVRRVQDVINVRNDWIKPPAS